MAESAHTLGPWKVGQSGGGPAVYPVGRRSMICALYTGETDATTPCRNHEANARLIAAAPDMLAALESLGPILEEVRVKWDEGQRAGKLLIALLDPKLRYRADTTAIHDAIAKAKGKA